MINIGFVILHHKHFKERVDFLDRRWSKFWTSYQSFMCLHVTFEIIQMLTFLTLCRLRPQFLKVWSLNGRNIWRTATELSAHFQKLVSLHWNVLFTLSWSLLPFWQRYYSWLTGIFCNGTFDMFVCWPHSPPGNVSVPCPSYLPWISEGNVVLPLFTFQQLKYEGIITKFNYTQKTWKNKQIRWSKMK